MKRHLFLTAIMASLLVSFAVPNVQAKAKADSPSYYIDQDGVMKPEKSGAIIRGNNSHSLVNDGNLIAPTNLSWSADQPGSATYTTADQKAFYFAWLERDGNIVLTWHLGEKPAGTYDIDWADAINESGSYRFYMKAAENDQDQDKDKGAISEKSPEFKYTRPSQVLATPTGLAWSKDKPGTATWQAVPYAKGYQVELQKGDEMVVGYFPSDTEYDFSKDMGDSTDKNYYFKVRALSTNINVYANGDYSELSEGFDGSTIDPSKDKTNPKTPEDTKNSIDAATTPAQAESALDAYIGNTDAQALALKMQTSTEEKQKIADLEESYKSKAKVSVANNITAPEIDSSKVKIIGAGLNASANSSVSFNISKTDESAKKAIDTDLYKNIIQFDMNLSNASKVSNDGKLAIPVEITMPVPAGMKPDITLKILHFHHSDDGFDIITPRFNSDGTISFTITHFSTFGFIDGLSVGDIEKDADGNSYKVTAEGEVEFIAPKDKKIKKLTIPDTVTLKKNEYKVTSIAANSVKGCKKLTTVTIGKNVTTIGKNAFKDDKKLKTIKIKSTTIKSIGKNAIKGIDSKATIKISGSKKQKKSITKLLKKSTGYKSSMKIKK